MNSADQDAWTDFAANIREQLRARVADMHRMTPEELTQYMDAVHAAHALALDAATHDKLIELEMARVTALD